MAVCNAMLSASLVERQLTYISNCSVRVLFTAVRLVTAAQSSAMACTKLAAAVPTGRPAPR